MSWGLIIAAAVAFLALVGAVIFFCDPRAPKRKRDPEEEAYNFWAIK